MISRWSARSLLRLLLLYWVGLQGNQVEVLACVVFEELDQDCMVITQTEDQTPGCVLWEILLLVVHHQLEHQLVPGILGLLVSFGFPLSEPVKPGNLLVKLQDPLLMLTGLVSELLDGLLGFGSLLSLVERLLFGILSATPRPAHDLLLQLVKESLGDELVLNGRGLSL